MAIQCTGMRLLACFPGKDLQFFMIFKGDPGRRPRGAQGDPKGAKALQREPKRAPGDPQGVPKGAPNGAKTSQQGRQLYKLTPDQPQSGRYVIMSTCVCVHVHVYTHKSLIPKVSKKSSQSDTKVIPKSPQNDPEVTPIESAT